MLLQPVEKVNMVFTYKVHTNKKKTQTWHVGLTHSKAMHGAFINTATISGGYHLIWPGIPAINKTVGGVSALPEPGGPNLPCHPGIRNPSYLSIRRKFLFHS